MYSNNDICSVIQKDFKLGPSVSDQGCDKECDLTEIEAELKEQSHVESRKESPSRPSEINNNEGKVEVDETLYALFHKVYIE